MDLRDHVTTWSRLYDNDRIRSTGPTGVIASEVSLEPYL
jgi:hypothetical protein